MRLAELSLRRPIFITCIVLVMIAVGLLSMGRLPVDLNPNVNIPVISVVTVYPGAGPSEMETMIAKPLENEISTISGLKKLTSKSMEGVTYIIGEFSLKTDIKYAEQQVRDRVNAVKAAFPIEVKEPVIRRFDINEQPVMLLALQADLPEGELFDLADETIRRRLEQVNQVGRIDLSGGRKREIQVLLDREKLRSRDLSVTMVASQLGQEGENIPGGKVSRDKDEVVFRTLGEFRSTRDIENKIVKFFGNEIPVNVRDIGVVRDTLADEQSRSFINGTKAIFFSVTKQSGSNTVEVADALRKEINRLNTEFKDQPGHPRIVTTLDLSDWIRMNVTDVKETILIGVLLTILTVYLFLANARSTFITGLALPNSLIGAFLMMALAGFTINTITLLALSLSVGLLIDDAIVVRENIFRHIEAGENPVIAARRGTKEVRLAVIATTLVVLAVFGPVAFMQGIIGQFFREFGLTICFAMLISLFDALTVAPMLSAYFAGFVSTRKPTAIWANTIGRVLSGFSDFQNLVDRWYTKALQFSTRSPGKVLGLSVLILIASLASTAFIKKTFAPEEDHGHFGIAMDMAPGTNLNEMERSARKVDELVRAHRDVEISALTVGGSQGQSNRAMISVKMVPGKSRELTTMELKEKLRGELQRFPELNPKVVEWASTDGENQQPFNLDVIGQDQEELEKAAAQIMAILQKEPGLKDLDSSVRAGRPEFQIKLNPLLAQSYGISTKSYGFELRAQVEGLTPAKFRENGKEYDIRVRLDDAQRDLSRDFQKVYVPNVNGSLIQLAKLSEPKLATGPTAISRQNRARTIMITASLAPGAGIGNIMENVKKSIDKEVKFPPGVRYQFSGSSEFFEEMATGMITAIFFSTLFIFMVLASLYESFVTPFTIMLALPLAISGAFIALLVTGEPISVYSMIGIILLLGVACKNSILLVDCARQFMAEGMSRTEAIIKAGNRRLRPILMTSMALIAGTIPVAFGLNEAAKMRTGMGIAIIGGLISSTVLTLVVVPAAFSYIERFRDWSTRKIKGWVGMSAKTAVFLLIGLGVLGQLSASHVFAFVIAHAAPAPSRAALSLATYLEQAEKENPSFRAARASTESARLLVDEGDLTTSLRAFGDFRFIRDRQPRMVPAFSGNGLDTGTLSIGLEKQTRFGLQGKFFYGLTSNNVYGIAPELLPNPIYYTGATTFELRQPLWRNGFGSETRALQKAAASGQLASFHSSAFELNSLKMQLELGYWRLFFARQLVRLQNDALERARKIRDWNAKRVNRDLADRGDLLQAEAGLQLRELEFKMAKDEERAAGWSFNGLRGKDSGEVPEALSDEPARYLARPIQQLSVDDRHDLRAAQMAQSGAEASATLGKEKTKPTVDLFATASLNGLANSAGTTFADSVRSQHPFISAGVSVSVPLDFSLTNQIKRGYQLDLLKSEHALNQTRLTAQRELKELDENTASVRQRLEIARKIEEAQKLKLEHERRLLYLGRTVTFRILQFELEYVQSQVARIREESALIAQIAQLRLYENVSP